MFGAGFGIGPPARARLETSSELLADRAPGDWTGTYFYVAVISPTKTEPSEIWFRAHDNGVSFGFTVQEWRTVHRLFQRAWDLPDIRVAWEALTCEYGEL